jgi:hypothetical protein
MDYIQQLALLQQKVDLTETHMNWVIGGVTLTITFLLALFAFIQFIYQKKLEEKRIKEVEDKLDKKIEKEFNEKEKVLKSIIESRISKTENSLKEEIRLQEADICRRFAIDCNKDNFFALSFTWWLRASALYAKYAPDDQLLNVSIKSAKDSLENVNTKIELENLFEYSSRVIENINALKSSHLIQAELLEKLFKEKIQSKPLVPVIQA